MECQASTEIHGTETTDGMSAAVRVPCELEDGHVPPHRFVEEWTEDGEPEGIANTFFVGMTADGQNVSVMRAMATQMMTVDDAMNLAAWIVCMTAVADPKGERWAGMLRRVQST